MILILKNIFLMVLVALPIIVIDFYEFKNVWIESNKEEISVVVFIIMLVLVYFWIAPNMGLEPNPKVERI